MFRNCPLKPSYLFLESIVGYLGNRTLSSNIMFHRDHIRKNRVIELSSLVMNSHLPTVIRKSWFFFTFSLEHTKKREISVRKFTLSKIGYSAFKRVQANWTIFSLVPDSCPPNWLHGKQGSQNLKLHQLTKTFSTLWINDLAWRN